MLHSLLELNASYAKKQLSTRLLSGLGSRVFVQNAISKNWDQRAVVKATRDNGESYIQLDNGKECIHGRILLRPVKSTITTAHSTPTLSTTAALFRRSARLQNRV